MRVLRSIVAPSSALVPVRNPKLASCRPIGPQVIGDQPLRDEAIFLQQLAHQLQRGTLVSLGLDQHVQNLALGNTARQK